ncbi:MAG: EAL domain-containing protein [Rhodobacteraceae bacterium]|nr:EAL domain-containing protein [Paracoccaceae bacterium]
MDFIDQSAASGFGDLNVFAGRFVVLSEAARVAVVDLLEALRTSDDDLIEEHGATLDRRTNFLWGFLLLVLIGGAGVLFLLRREVVERQQREQAENRADFLAYFDPLTELPNRVQFHETVHSKLQAYQGGALLFLDLDNFKGINDTMGHAMGDAVLVAVARRIEAQTRQMGGIASRLSGDEFAVFLPQQDEAALADFATRLVGDCALLVEFDQKTVTPGVSIGIVTTGQAANILDVSYKVLCRFADFALYAAKTQGKGSFSFFDAELQKTFTERRVILDALPDAIQNEELEVYLQPKVVLESGAIYGFEALVRWEHKARKVPPDELIRLAEESGTVTDIDRYALRAALDGIADWNRRYATSYGLSVNLSALNFKSDDIVAEVAGALKRSGCPAPSLTLEITETIQLDDWTQVSEILSGLRELGCRISIDDFGTGYSSLVYLRAMMADELKIDKSLSDGIENSDQNRFVIDAVIDLAHSLGMDVVVEGVETHRQAEVLRNLGCRKAQGYLFGRPLPAAEALLKATNAASPDHAQSG